MDTPYANFEIVNIKICKIINLYLFDHLTMFSLKHGSFKTDSDAISEVPSHCNIFCDDSLYLRKL